MSARVPATIRPVLERLAASWLGFACASACVPEGPPTPAPARDSAAEGVAAEEAFAPFRDDFERAELGDDYVALSSAWHLEQGKLCASGAKNQGVWLARALPPRVRIELDAVALDAAGDLKVEIFGDGRSGATKTTYDDATGYLAVLGGWKNTLHVLARLNEHGDDRLVIEVAEDNDDPRTRPVQPGQPYHFKFERRNDTVLSWWVNGILYLELNDEEPLSGVGHDHFGFNDWVAPVCFDNLEITPL